MKSLNKILSSVLAFIFVATIGEYIRHRNLDFFTHRFWMLWAIIGAVFGVIQVLYNSYTDKSESKHS